MFAASAVLGRILLDVFLNLIFTARKSFSELFWQKVEKSSSSSSSSSSSNISRICNNSKEVILVLVRLRVRKIVASRKRFPSRYGSRPGFAEQERAERLVIEVAI